jgi:adenine-specific DNA-methyltransferase
MKSGGPFNPAKTKRATRIARTLRKHDTWAEKLLWRWLRDRHFSQYKFRRQHPYGPHILDFFCLEAKLDIELDGFQHGTPDQMVKDQERDAYLEQRGIKVLRFWNARLRREPQVVRDTIWRVLQERAPHPLPDYCGPDPLPQRDAGS